MHDDQNLNNLKPGLYCVATPIGNLGDITLRALEVIKNSDLILCEDTRVSKKLLSKFNIHKKLISNHKFNENKNINFILEYLENNKIISIISDAGTPAISDPGRILINKCIEKNINIYSVPGPSAVGAAISVSGFSDKYLLGRRIVFMAKKQQSFADKASKQSKKEFGTRLTVIGLGLVLLQILPFYIIDQNLVGLLGRFFEVIYFLVSMFCLTVGLYFALGSYLTRAPHTSALFVLPGGKKDLIALFPGWDSEEAERMARGYRRIRRTL